MKTPKPYKQLPTLLGAIALASMACQLHAAGFQLKEQSAEGQGNSFAGQTAKAVDASTIFFNPAGMTLVPGSQVQTNVSYIAPTADYKHKSNNATSPFTKTTDIDGGVSAFVPAAYALWDYNDQVKLGVSVNVPFGLSTEYDKSWIGAQYNVLSAIETINIAPSIAYKVNDKFSIGGNVQFQKIKGKLTSQNILPGPSVVSTTLKADDTGFGFGFGMLYQYSDKGRIGFNYRSEINHTLEGDVSTPNVAALSFDAKADVTMPAVASVGIYHEVSDQWTVLADIAWTDWSEFDELQIVNTDTNTDVANPTQYNWSDTVFAAVGANYQYNDKLQLKFGIAYDEGAANNEDRTAGIPDATRYWASIGASYEINRQSTVNVGYSHIKAHSVGVSEDTKTGSSYSGTFKPHVNILSMGYTHKF